MAPIDSTNSIDWL